MKKMLPCLMALWPLLVCPVNAQPNVIVIFMDDLGYNDIGAQTYPNQSNYYPSSGPTPQPNYTDPDIPAPNQARLLTPSIDSIATQGLRMTRFYSSPKCSPSRGSLLTGRYDRRISINAVFFPTYNNGLNTTEVTLPELLRQQGYATGMVGKWHLGYNPNKHSPWQMMPLRHGFSEFFGTPHSNDMSDFHLIRNETVEVANFSSATEQAQITWRYTEAALDFIQRSTANDKPFFLYFAHSMTHIPCWPSDREFTNADGTVWPKFLGSSGVSQYYDVVKEVDHSVGRILGKLDDLAIADNTVVIFTSDNGPWLRLSNINLTDRSVGSAYPLQDGKFTTWEGGCRVPFLVRWPGKIAANTVSNQVAGLVDLLPTCVTMAGGTVPGDRTIDGVDISGHWEAEPGWTSPRSAYALFDGDGNLEAVIKGDWKLRDGKLYNLASDVQEQTDLAGSQTAVMNDMNAEKASIAASISAETSPRGIFTNYEVLLSANDVQVAEGGTATLDVQLSANPGKTVVVTVSHFSGDADLSVASGASLTFTTGNWNTPQTVTLAASQDADTAHSGATFRLTTDDILQVRELFAFEVDDDAAAAVETSLEWPKVDSVVTQNASVKLLVEGSVLVGASQNPAGSTFQWLKVSGPGAVTFTDPTAPRTGVSFGMEGTYRLRFQANHPGAGGFDTVDFTATVGASGAVTPGAFKYAPLLAHDATEDTDGDSVWENVQSPGTRDWALAANVTRTTADPAPQLDFIDAAWTFSGGAIPSGGVSADYDAYSLGNASFEFWFKPASLPTATQQVLWETGGNTGASFVLDGNQLRFVVDAQASGAIAEGTLSPASAQDGFVHCVGVIDLANDQIKLYIDGALVDTKAIASVTDWAGVSGSGLGTITDSSVVETSSQSHLGGNMLLSGTHNPFAGMVAHYLFYDKALTAGEITDLASGPRTPDITLNVAPVVAAGADQSVAYTDGANLVGSATDDGLPASGSLTTAWSLYAGPASPAFGDINAQSTTASFSLPGTHQLWLEADDGEVKVFDAMTVTVAPFTYAEWADGISFPAGQDGAEDNPDGDAWNNAWEWLFGSNPLVDDSSLNHTSSATQGAGENTTFSFEFVIPRNREPDLFLQSNEDLSPNWNDLNAVLPTVEVIDAQTARWTFELSVDMTLKTRYFVRAKLNP